MFYVDLSGVKTIIIPVDPLLNIVSLPTDFIDYVRIGRALNGRIITLSLNPDMVMPYDEVCALPVNNDTTAALWMPTVSQPGLGGGYNYANYRVDKRERRIIFEGVIPGAECYLEYLSTGISLSEKTFIDRRAVETILAFLDWQMAENEKGIGSVEKQRKLNIYNGWVQQLTRNIRALTVDEMLDAMRRGYRRSPKTSG
jgi:hypothetical protein